MRADAIAGIGTGHLMRCLALAQTLRASGYDVIFITVCENRYLNQRILDQGFRVIAPGNPHPDPTDWETTSQALQAHPTAWVVIDGYHFDAGYQDAIRKAGHRLMVIDDYNHLSAYHASILLNQNIGSDKLIYSHDVDTVGLFGPRYALLRSEFLTWKSKIQHREQHAHNILVTLGGEDPQNISLKVVRALLRTTLDNLETRVVVGPMNTAVKTLLNEIEDARGAHIPIAKGINVIHNGNMPELMAHADVAISGGGSTCWELCFFGIPLLVIIVADNQRNIAEGLEQEKAAICLGWHSEVSEDHIKTQLEMLVTDIDKRRTMSENGRTLVDGKGCSRVLREIQRFS